jgi:hypothetical protein
MSKISFNGTRKTNIVLYPPNGTGRDIYISHNCGGFWKNKFITHKENSYRKSMLRFHSLKQIPPIWQYHPDGTGRDNYILNDNGGFFHHLPSIYRKIYRSSYEEPSINLSQKSLTKKEKFINKKLFQIQTDLIKRLYYDSPRNLFKKMEKDMSSPSIFKKIRLNKLETNKSPREYLLNEQDINRYNNLKGIISPRECFSYDNKGNESKVNKFRRKLQNKKFKLKMLSNSNLFSETMNMSNNEYKKLYLDLV